MHDLEMRSRNAINKVINITFSNDRKKQTSSNGNLQEQISDEKKTIKEAGKLSTYRYYD